MLNLVKKAQKAENIKVKLQLSGLLLFTKWGRKPEETQLGALEEDDSVIPVETHLDLVHDSVSVSSSVLLRSAGCSWIRSRQEITPTRIRYDKALGVHPGAS